MYLTQVWIFFIFWVCPWGMVTQRQVSSGQEFSMETDTVFMEHFPMTLRTSDHDEHTTPPRVTLTLCMFLPFLKK
ncbi:hypothetical protein HMI55_004431 [Coelomomyces lativittatus]|nr:hypothetical protein HMI55_004431 [Coelomomyces lativittatus]